MTQPNAPKLPLLRSESPTEFLAFRKRLNEEVQPQGVIQERYFEDFAALDWEIRRLRGLRVSTIEQAYGPALRHLLKQILLNDLPDPIGLDKKVRILAQGWLENAPAAKKDVVDILGRAGLDEAAIEAQAVKLSIEELQYFDRSLATMSGRRDRTLRTVMEYSNSDFAARLRQKSGQILNEPLAAQPIASDDAGQKAAA